MHDVYYKGETHDVRQRLEAQNLNKSKYTANKGVWVLVYLEIVPTRTKALKREKTLKRQNGNYLEWLIKQPFNLKNNAALSRFGYAERIRVPSAATKNGFFDFYFKLPIMSSGFTHISNCSLVT
jgi:putative endonuclease